MTIEQEIITSYENTPYPYLGYQQTHPDTAASIATILGLTPTDVEHCRVLEVGCAVGGNLIPMAFALPDSQFVGFDISPVQIEAGQAMISDMGLTNIELKTLDIMEITGASLGKFDYIIAHGIYSWVPDNVRDQLLVMCRELLTENGIANISYNVLPGWKMMGMLRDMMLHHTRDTDDPDEKVAESRELAEASVTKSVPKLNKGSVSFYSSYRDFLEGYNEFVIKGRDESSFPANLMLHDEIAVINHPVYFHQFAEHIDQHNLQYVSEASLSKVMPTNLPDDVSKEVLAMSGDIIEMEQYMDFLYNRTFRQTLICHKERDINRMLSPTAEMMEKFYCASNAQLTTPHAMLSETGVARWKGSDGAEFATDHPVTKQAMAHLLEQFPLSVRYSDLYKIAMQQTYSRIPDDAEQRDIALLSVNLLRMFSYSDTLMEFHTIPTRCTTKIANMPKVSVVARKLVEKGYSTVSNMRHQRVQLDPLAQLILPLLDGEHSQRALITHLKGLVESGKITLESPDGTPLTKAKLQSRIKHELNQQLQWFAHAALLID